MLLVSVTQARPGMKLAMPVMHPDRPDTTLLRDGFVLDELTVAGLRSLRLPHIWIVYPDLAFVAKYVSPELVRARGEIGRLIGDVIDRIGADASPKLDYEVYKGVVRDFVARFRDERNCGLFLQTMAEGDRPLMRHSADVCVLAMLMGIKLDAYIVAQRRRVAPHRAKDVVNLGVAGMLHDIGMLDIAPDAAERWRRHHDYSDPAWRKHVRFGYERVKGQVEASAASAILHHHQRYDGTGFPSREFDTGIRRAPRGPEIHVFARIIAVADLFDRLRHPHGGPAVPAVSAYARLLRPPLVDWCDPHVLGALIQTAPAYGPGTVVRLSSGHVAAVVDWSDKQPCRPTVQLLTPPDSLGRARENAHVRYDLRQHPELSIVEVDGLDVSRDNFELTGTSVIFPWPPRSPAAADDKAAA
ncbi:MAG: HD domain-containing protein [Phycisphaerales bacterium]|nr:HD domain-containing protein [Phycisphaerales bacterium]